MSSTAATLASSFHRTYRGADAAAGNVDPRALEAALEDVVSRGRAAWPDVRLDPSVLAGYLGERAPVVTGGDPPTEAGPPPPTHPGDVETPQAGRPQAGADLLGWLGGLPAGDVFLACACAEGLPPALRAFDAAFCAKIEVYLRALRPTPELIAETRQELLEKLFVGVSGKPPTILQYTGQGALGGWVRISAVRTALNLMASEKSSQPRLDEASEVASAMVPDSDPELELIRASCKEEFTAAFREAMASLPRRSRSMLRFTFVERILPARIAAIYGVHRTTVMRWIDAAQEEVLARTRALMMERLSLTPSECDRIFALVKSRMDISIRSLLNTES